jgi:hypothetical protein
MKSARRHGVSITAAPKANPMLPAPAAARCSIADSRSAFRPRAQALGVRGVSKMCVPFFGHSRERAVAVALLRSACLSEWPITAGSTAWWQKVSCAEQPAGTQTAISYIRIISRDPSPDSINITVLNCLRRDGAALGAPRLGLGAAGAWGRLPPATPITHTTRQSVPGWFAGPGPLLVLCCITCGCIRLLKNNDFQTNNPHHPLPLPWAATPASVVWRAAWEGGACVRAALTAMQLACGSRLAAPSSQLLAAAGQ